MKFIAKQFALWRVGLLLGLAVLAIPMVAKTNAAKKLPTNERTEYWSDRVERRVDIRQEYVDRRVEVRQDVNERRRDYWSERVERRW